MTVAIDKEKLEQLEEKAAKLRREIDEFSEELALARAQLNGQTEQKSYLELKGVFGGWLNADDELLEECRLKFG